MDFAFTDEQVELRRAVRDWLADTHGPDVLRRLEEAGSRAPALWDGLLGMGIAGLIVPKPQGGLGLGLVEAALIATELGRANVSEPIVDTALVAPRLIEDAHTLAAIARGEAKISLAHPINPWVADADTADHVLGGSATGERLASIDPLRRLFALHHAEDDPAMLDLAALMAAAQLVGGAERMLDLAAAYARERKQFGQPIGGFQAIKHQLAHVAIALEFARPVLWRAAYALEYGHGRAPIHVSHAKVAANDAAMVAAEIAIQVHGAMGYTYEVELHFWMKRAWALTGAWGDSAFHLGRLETAVIGGGIALGPAHSFEEF